MAYCAANLAIFGQNMTFCTLPGTNHTIYGTRLGVNNPPLGGIRLENPTLSGTEICQKGTLAILAYENSELQSMGVAPPRLCPYEQKGWTHIRNGPNGYLNTGKCKKKLHKMYSLLVLEGDSPGYMKALPQAYFTANPNWLIANGCRHISYVIRVTSQ